MEPGSGEPGDLLDQLEAEQTGVEFSMEPGSGEPGDKIGSSRRSRPLVCSQWSRVLENPVTLLTIRG